MPKEIQRAVLVGLHADALGEQENASDETLDELSMLLETAGGTEAGRVFQKRNAPDPRTFVGSGKLTEIVELCRAAEAELVVFDSELSPSQRRHVEDALDVAVLDRSGLILDIFAARAKTAEGKLQVELAQYEYLLPRLMGQGNILSRLGGGIGTRGPGETKLETDRRHIRSRIRACQKDLEDVRRRRAVSRKQRQKNGIPVVSLAGYTNAGKSSLLNALCGAEVSAANRLFETLDTTARKLRLEDGRQVILTDTVGFIRKLPHHLIKAFRATLEELSQADILLHVIDGSSAEWRALEQSSGGIINDFCTPETPRLRVFNKCDLPNSDPLPPQSVDTLYVSAKTGEGLSQLREAIGKLTMDNE